MLESLAELRTFLRVVDEGSLSAAARSLGLSVNAVSRRLALLEDRVGVRLANRTTRRLVVTDEGRRLAERCRRILDEVEAAQSDLQAGDGALRGLVRVGIHPELVGESLLRRLGELLGDHAGISLHLLAHNAPVDPLQEGLDLLVWGGEVSMQSVVSRLIRESDWVLAASTEYARRAGLPRRPEDLARHECLRALRARAETTWELRDGDGRTVTVQIRGRFESDDTATLKAALYAGLGIGVRPRGEVVRASAEGKLVAVLPRWRFGSNRIHLVSPPGRMRLPRVRAVAAVIEEAARTLA
jgi:DNA-binding transcriptional LysR family regulator